MLAKLDLDNDKLGSGYKNYRKISGNAGDPKTSSKMSSSPAKGKSTNKKGKVKKEK